MKMRTNTNMPYERIMYNANDQQLNTLQTIRPQLTKCEYEPVSSSRKLQLLLQRSLRYSYRQRYCGRCPTILCELLFPLLLLVVLGLTRYGLNGLVRETTGNSTGPTSFKLRECSQAINIPPSRSNDLFNKCFKFPPSYDNRNSSETAFVFQPVLAQVDELVSLAKNRLTEMNCSMIDVRSDNPDDVHDNQLLNNSNTVIINFGSEPNLKSGRTLAYNIYVRMPNLFLKKNIPVDTSFVEFKHPTLIEDRANTTNLAKSEGSELPEFTDVKIFVDSLLIGYQTDRNNTRLDIERNAIRCTPFKDDAIFATAASFASIILFFIDIVFLIPYIILFNNLIREKNTKVKEILKVLGIEPILNNIAHAIRTLAIFVVLILLLCIMYKIKLKPDAYFNTVNFAVLFFGYLILGLQFISFCIMNAQLFNVFVRGLIINGIFYAVSSGIHGTSMQWPVALQYVFIFISPFFAARSIFQQAVLHDLAKMDVLAFRTIYYRVPMFFVTLLIMLFSCVFYWALAWYLEKVFPGEYGIPMEWNFLFKRAYWRSAHAEERPQSFSNSMTNHSKNSASPLSRSNSSGSAAIVHVSHLVKKFGADKIAVNNISFDLYENQITSLLGPNGSGKTTIFNCLIGIYKQTSGTILIANDDGVDYDTRQNIETLRKSMGYCPQHDILFDLLTIEEQLIFYATARGFGRNKEQIANEMLQLVNLTESKDLYCKSLSGGMKRRLSLACAFVGDTKIVLLDEPSSGLDPSNRRLLWDWLRSMKEGKTLLLTTHFMEESDALSDRIMIIANGSIKVDGTSAKLKEQYGSGYKFIVSRKQGNPTGDIENQLRQYLPQLTIETDTPGGDIVIRTNQQPNNQFIGALRELETMKENNRIQSYGVQNSTLDDVFVKITRDTSKENESGTSTVNIERIDEQCRQVFNDRQFNEGIHYYLSQLQGLAVKTFQVRYRRWTLTLIILLLPIIYNLLTNVLSQSRQGTGVFTMDLKGLDPQTIWYQADSTMEEALRAAVGPKKDVRTLLQQAGNNFSELHEKIWQKRMERPYIYNEIFLGIKVPPPIGDNYTMQALSSNLISSYEVIALASNTFFKYATNDSSASIQTTLVYKKTNLFTFQTPNLGDILNLISMFSCFSKFLPTSLLLEVFIVYLIFLYTAIFLVSERKDSFLSLLNISGLHPALYWIFNYVFDIILSIVWFCYLLLIFSIFDVAFNGTPSSRPKTSLALEFEDPWDLRIQFYPLTIIIILPTLPLVYLLTKIFKSDILGGIAIFFILSIIHFLSIVVPFVLMIAKQEMPKKIVYWLFNILFPSINAQAIVTYILANGSKYCKIFIQNTSGEGLFEPIGDNTMWLNGLLLVFHIVIILLVLIIIDSGFLQFSLRRSYISQFDSSNIDDDVLAERDRIFRTNTLMDNRNPVNAYRNEDDVDHLVVNDLVKYYPVRRVLAVNHLTFGAKRGEAFGLLGYNGAGKTTTFRIVVGDLMATRGTAFIDGQNVHRRLKSLRHLGYCPQENCGMDFLTVRDSLYLIARIRAVPASRIDTIVSTMASLFLLDPFLNNYIHELSGGTKRRLHAAIALTGPPLVAILDEPTTGVDPNARQQMQEIFLNAVKAKLTIILTSHSMDECERVCDRLGIMVAGQFACLGTIQHLKSKFGQGYSIDIKIRSMPGSEHATNIQQFQEFLFAQPGFQVEVKETTQSTGLFQIVGSAPAELFELLEQNRQRFNIETYTVSQTTLEQIFLSFGKQIRAELQ